MKKIFLIIFPAVLILACNRSKGPSICTDDFRMITLVIKHSSGQLAVLDSSYTVRVNTGEKIRPQQNMGMGYYVVLDDGYQPILKNREEDFRFVGWKNNIIVADQVYRIGADNCHIYKKTGLDSLVLQ